MLVRAAVPCSPVLLFVFDIEGTNRAKRFVVNFDLLDCKGGSDFLYRFRQKKKWPISRCLVYGLAIEPTDGKLGHLNLVRYQ